MLRTDHSSGQHVCTGCGVLKDCSAFSPRSPRTYNEQHESACRLCRAAQAKAYKKGWEQRTFRQRYYNLSQEDYEKMLAEQGNVCAICRKPNSERLQRALHVDHNHETGRVRGLLCGKCNFGIGLLGNYLEIAREYLARG